MRPNTKIMQQYIFPLLIILLILSQAQKMGFQGRCIGVKLAEENKREFDESTLNEGKKHSSLFTAGTNKGASQAGQTAFGMQRKL